ncbi:MAG: hypothetical protein ACLU1W_09465, partial [Collinsella sp.]
PSTGHPYYFYIRSSRKKKEKDALLLKLERYSLSNERNPSAQQDRPFGDGFVLAGWISVWPVRARAG